MLDTGLDVPPAHDGMALYRIIEEHLGGLDQRAVSRLQRMNLDERYVFGQACRDAVLALEPPPLPPGVLRPDVRARLQGWLSPAERNGLAVKLLLYAPEVLLEPTLKLDKLNPFRDAERFAYDLASLTLIRPLVEARAIWFGNAPEIRAQQAREGPITHAGPGGGVDSWVLFDMYELWPGRFTPLFLNHGELEAAARVIESLQLSRSDKRMTRLQRIATIEVPGLETAPSTILKVRESEVAFAEWRQALGNAVEQIEELAESETWQSEARAIVEDELAPMAAKMERAVTRSSVLSRARMGAKEFAFAAIGAGVGATVTGGVSGALAGAAASASAVSVQTLADTLSGRRESRAQRAVLQLTALFSDARRERG